MTSEERDVDMLRMFFLFYMYLKDFDKFKKMTMDEFINSFLEVYIGRKDEKNS